MRGRGGGGAGGSEEGVGGGGEGWAEGGSVRGGSRRGGSWREFLACVGLRDPLAQRGGGGVGARGALARAHPTASGPGRGGGREGRGEFGGGGRRGRRGQLLDGTAPSVPGGGGRRVPGRGGREGGRGSHGGSAGLGPGPRGGARSRPPGAYSYTQPRGMPRRCICPGRAGRRARSAARRRRPAPGSRTTWADGRSARAGRAAPGRPAARREGRVLAFHAAQSDTTLTAPPAAGRQQVRGRRPPRA